VSRVEGKLYRIGPADNKVSARYLGGDESDPMNWQELSWFERLAEAASGEGWNEENLPSLRDFLYEDHGIEGLETTSNLWPAMMFAHDDEKIVQAAEGNIPNVKITRDKIGNPIAEIPRRGQPPLRAYLNKPGFSSQDFSEGLGTVGMMVPAARALKVGAAGVGALSNMARLGISGAGASAVSDVATGALSGQGPVESVLDVNVQRAGIEGGMEALFGVAGEAAQLAIPRLRQLITRGTPIVDRRGNLTAEARRTFDELGVNWEQQTQEFRERVIQDALGGRVSSPREALALAEAQTLPGPNVPMTRGQVTGSRGEQIREDLLSKGVYGEPVARRMVEAERATQDALEENLTAVQQVLAGSGPTVRRNEGVQAVQQSLGRQRVAAKQGVDRAYDAARSQGPASYPKPAIATMADTIERQWRQDFAPDILTGSASSMVKQLRDLAERVDAGGVDVRELFEWRQRASNSAAFGTPESKALGNAIKTFDTQMDDALSQALLRGSDDAISVWRDAIGKARGFKQRWESADLIDNLTQPRRGTSLDAMEFKVAPEDAANYLFGISNMGFVSKRNLSRDLRKMKELLPESDFNQLKQELFLRMVDTSRRVHRGETIISGVKLNNAMSDLAERNSALLNSVFTGSEVGMIRQLGRVADRATTVQRQTSNTAVANQRILQELIGNAIRTFSFAGPQIDKLLLLLPLGIREGRERGAMLGLDKRIDYPGSARRMGPELPAVGAATTLPMLEEEDASQ